MNRETPSALLLFELIARRWTVPAPARGLVFNAAQSRLIAPLADGSIALVDAADPEPPDSRIAEDEAGRKTIAPRRSSPRPATIVPAVGKGKAEAVRGSGDGFVVAWRDGGLAHLDADGTAKPLPPFGSTPVLALDRRGATLIVSEAEVTLRPDEGAPIEGRTPAGTRAAALSPDGRTIAFGGDDGIALSPASAPGEIVKRFAVPGPISRIVWRDDGAFLAACCEGEGLALLGLRDGRLGRIGSFPTPPRSIAFSAPCNALVASGAFRIAAWDLDRPPFDGDQSGALETGRAGMVAVVEVAAHPKRRLVAAAFADGQIVIAEPGRRDEMLLKASGATPAALAWSDDGRMLAIASEDAVSLVTLPDALFKST